MPVPERGRNTIRSWGCCQGPRPRQGKPRRQREPLILTDRHRSTATDTAGGRSTPRPAGRHGFTRVDGGWEGDGNGNEPKINPSRHGSGRERRRQGGTRHTSSGQARIHTGRRRMGRRRQRKRATDRPQPTRVRADKRGNDAGRGGPATRPAGRHGFTRVDVGWGGDRQRRRQHRDSSAPEPARSRSPWGGATMGRGLPRDRRRAVRLTADSATGRAPRNDTRGRARGGAGLSRRPGVLNVPSPSDCREELHR
jgi:hypothetical protein